MSTSVKLGPESIISTEGWKPKPTAFDSVRLRESIGRKQIETARKRYESDPENIKVEFLEDVNGFISTSTLTLVPDVGPVLIVTIPMGNYRHSRDYSIADIRPNIIFNRMPPYCESTSPDAWVEKSPSGMDYDEIPDLVDYDEEVN